MKKLSKIAAGLDILAGTLFLASAVLSGQLMYYALSVAFVALGVSGFVTKHDD